MCPLDQLLFTQLNQSSKPWQQNPDDSSFKTLRRPTKTFQGINPMDICDPFVDSYLHHWINAPNLNQQTLMVLLSKPWDAPLKKIQGINPMVLCAPWSDSYLHNWINNSNLNHQTLMTLLWTTVIFKLKQWKTLTKQSVPNYVYK